MPVRNLKKMSRATDGVTNSYDIVTAVLAYLRIYPVCVDNTRAYVELTNYLMV